MITTLKIDVLKWFDSALPETQETTMDKNLVSEIFDVSKSRMFSIVVEHTVGASPVGEFTLEARNATNVGFITVSGTLRSVPLTDRRHMWDVVSRGYRTLRVRYDFTSGVAVVSGNAYGSGDKD